MTEEPTSGTVVGDTGVRGLDARTSEPDWEHEEYHGRPVSWVAVAIITVGFVVGGFSMVPTPTWWLFWTAAAITAVGLGVGALARMSEDWY